MTSDLSVKKIVLICCHNYHHSARAYQFVLCIPPVSRDLNLPLVHPNEILRLVNDEGFACIGMKNSVWDMHDAMEFFQQDSYKLEGIRLLSMQSIKLLPSDYNETSPTDKPAKNISNNTTLNPSSVRDTQTSIEPEKYWLGLLKRGGKKTFG